MKIKVPFIYSAKIIKPRCQKPTTVYLKDSVSVTIKELNESQLPVAFTIGESQLHWDGKQLWKQRTMDNYPVLACDVKNLTENSGTDYRYSFADDQAPFHNFWNPSFGECVILADDFVIDDKSSLTYREWVSDNRQDVIKKARDIAKSMLICNSVLYKPAGEPYYGCTTFGLGRNHGGTTWFTMTTFDKKLTERFQFNALHYDEAITYAEKVAVNRGDTKNIPMVLNGEKIIVLLPEAVKLKQKPNKTQKG